MRFLCLICATKMMEHLCEDEVGTLFAEHAEFIQDIKNKGQFIGGNRLLPPESAVTVRVRDGKISTTDGPYAETKEQLGGYYLIEAKDLNAAIQVAAKIPGARYGCVEIRAVAQDAQTLALGLEN